MDELHMMKYSRTTHTFILYDCPLAFLFIDVEEEGK